MLPFIYPCPGEAIKHQSNQDLDQGTKDGRAQILRQKNPRAFMNAKPGILQIL